jgi:hypothetical protein
MIPSQEVLTRNVSQLRRVLERSEALCTAMDECEYVLGFDHPYGPDMHAIAVRDELRVMLAEAERRLLANWEERYGGDVRALAT